MYHLMCQNSLQFNLEAHEMVGMAENGIKAILILCLRCYTFRNYCLILQVTFNINKIFQSSKKKSHIKPHYYINPIIVLILQHKETLQNFLKSFYPTFYHLSNVSLNS